MVGLRVLCVWRRRILDSCSLSVPQGCVACCFWKGLALGCGVMCVTTGACPVLLMPATLCISASARRGQVISARQLPKPMGAQKGEIIDPYVSLSMHGVSADNRKAKSTKYVEDNGFNPVWNESFTFEVRPARWVEGGRRRG